MASVVQAGHAVDGGQLLVPHSQSAIVVQGDVLPRGDHEGQQHRPEQDAAQGVELDAAQAEDG